MSASSSSADRLDAGSSGGVVGHVPREPPLGFRSQPQAGDGGRRSRHRQGTRRGRKPIRLTPASGHRYTAHGEMGHEGCSLPLACQFPGKGLAFSSVVASLRALSTSMPPTRSCARWVVFIRVPTLKLLPAPVRLSMFTLDSEGRCPV